MATSYKFVLHRVNSTTSNPILLEGEPGYDLVTKSFKIGDGSTVWSALPEHKPDTLSELTSTELAAHVASATPHPVYDDGPSLVLLYENAKV